jgi:hypothetical protein
MQWKEPSAHRFLWRLKNQAENGAEPRAFQRAMMVANSTVRNWTLVRNGRSKISLFGPLLMNKILGGNA